MNVVTGDAEEVGGIADIDRHLRRDGRDRRLEASPRRLADEQRLHAVAPILDHALNDEPPFGDEQSLRSAQLRVRHAAVARDPRIVRTHSIDRHDPGLYSAFHV